ncbi:apolipoprotein L3-like isoform X2, partial [Huso huso]
STEQSMEEFVQLFKSKKPVTKRHLRELKEIADGLDEASMNATLAKTIGSFLGAAGDHDLAGAIPGPRVTHSLQFARYRRERGLL